MKKQCVSPLVIIPATSGFLFSCGDKMNKNTGVLESDSIQVSETTHLFGNTTKPVCNLIINFTYPVKSSDNKLKDSLNDYLIAAYFGEGYIGEKSAKVIKEYTEHYVKEYYTDLKPTYAEDEKNKESEGSIGAWYSYYKGIESHVQPYHKDLLVHRINYNERIGGTHGIYMITFLNMDLINLRPLKLDDIFTGDYKEALTDLLWSQLTVDKKVTTREALEDTGYGPTGDIAPTENFHLDKDGIIFYYNAYDITPYAMGPVEIRIPYEMMEHMLGNNPIIGEMKTQ